MKWLWKNGEQERIWRWGRSHEPREQAVSRSGKGPSNGFCPLPSPRSSPVISVLDFSSVRSVTGFWLTAAKRIHCCDVPHKLNTAIHFFTHSCKRVLKLLPPSSCYRWVQCRNQGASVLCPRPVRKLTGPGAPRWGCLTPKPTLFLAIMQPWWRASFSTMTHWEKLFHQ